MYDRFGCSRGQVVSRMVHPLQAWVLPVLWPGLTSACRGLRGSILRGSLVGLTC